MGGVKRQMEDDDARYQWGLLICLKTGAVHECEYHPGSYYEGSAHLEDAIALAATPEDEKIITQAYHDNSGLDSCISCDKFMEG